MCQYKIKSPFNKLTTLNARALWYKNSPIDKLGTFPAFLLLKILKVKETLIFDSFNTSIKLNATEHIHYKLGKVPSIQIWQPKVAS